MDLQSMKKVLSTTLDGDMIKTPANANNIALNEMSAWMRNNAKSLHPSNHHLQVNPIRISHAKGVTSVRRTAHLMLRAEATSTPHANPEGKMLLRHAVDVTVSWDNEA